MTRVMIVDDEPHVHSLLEREVRWEEAGYELAGHALSGAEALKLLTQSGNPFDIILTDLNMSPMDGFAFLEKARSICPDTRFVILTVYSDYENIRKAFKCGAADYILKFEVRHDYVINILNSVIKKKNSAAGRTLEEEFHQALHEQRLGLAQLENLCQGGRLVLCICDMRHPAEPGISGRIEISQPDMLKICREALSPCPHKAVVILNEQAVFLLRLDSSVCSELKLRRFLYDTGTNIGRAVYSQSAGRISLAASDIFEGISQIPEHYISACHRINLFYFSEKEFLFTKDPAAQCGGLPKPESVITRLCNAIIQNQAETAVKIIEDTGWHIRQNHVFNRQAVEAFYIELLGFSNKMLSEKGIRTSLSDLSEEIYTEIMSFETLKGIILYLQKIFTEACEICGKAGGDREERIIYRALQYINEHCSESVSLKSVAGMIGLSENYVSSLFTKVTGRRFSAHLTEARINYAKQCLIKNDDKIYNIAEQCGYACTEHFSRSFKKITGVSPIKYKLTNKKE
jgi:YesN/AraC family two-component response regulator